MPKGGIYVQKYIILWCNDDNSLSTISIYVFKTFFSIYYPMQPKVISLKEK